MEITTTQLQSIYNQTMQYCIAKYGTDPDRIVLLESGMLEATWISYSYGDSDYDYEYISPESLSKNLEELYIERKTMEEENRKIAEQIKIAEQKVWEDNEKEKRRQKFLELKKEFE